MTSIEIHRNVEEYLAALRLLQREPAPSRLVIPILRDELSEPIDRWIAARALEPTAANPPAARIELRTGIVAYLDESLKDVAQALARFTARRACQASHGRDGLRVEDDDDLSSLFLLAPKAALSPRLLDEVSAQSRLRPAGILAAHNLQEMAFAIAKTLHAHVHPDLARTLSVSVANDDRMQLRDGSLFVSPAELDAAECPELFGHDYGLVVVGGHGNNIDVVMGSNLSLCARRKRLSWERGPLDSCEVDPAYCVRQLRGIPHRFSVDDVRARLLFISTCAGIAPADGIHSETLLLRNAVFRGQAAAVLSYCAVSLTSRLEDGLLVAMLNDGNTFGQATSAMMAMLSQRTSPAASALVLFGDPDLRIAAPAVAPPLQTLVPVARVDAWLVQARLERHHTILEIADGDVLPPATEIVTREIALAGIAGDHAPDGSATLLFQAGTPARIHALVRERPSVGGFELSARLIHVPPRRARTTALERNIVMLQTLVAARALRMGNDSNDPFLASLRGLLARSTEIRKSLRQFNFARHASQRANAGLVARLESQMAAAHADFLRDARAWDLGYVFGVYYVQDVITDEATEPSTCPYCGSNAFISGCSVIDRPDVRRYRTFCSRCTVICDGPAPVASVVIECDEVLAAGATVRVRVRAPALGPAFDRRVALAFEGYKLDWLDWRCVSATDESSGTPPASWAFDLHVGEASTPGVYFLMATLLSDLGIHFATRPVHVTAPLASPPL